MTADIELLPLPRTLQHADDADLATHVQDYARANVAHATAAKDAEIEALRAEMERLTFEMGCLREQYDERTACMIVHRGSALACSAAVRAAYSEEHHRAERLAEALRDIESRPWNGVRPIQIASRAALRDHDQEVGNG